MLNPFRTNTPVIGLDVGSESIKLLQLVALPVGLKVGTAVRVAIPDDVKGDPDQRVAFAGETVRCALRENIFLGRRVVAALPKELLHFKTHRLAPMAAEDVSMAGRIDGRELFRFDPDSTEVQVLDAGEIRVGEDDRREVILVAAGKPHIDAFVIALRRAGARIESLDIDPCAIWRMARRITPDDASHAHTTRAILDIGAFQSRLILGHGGAIRVIRTIDVGADPLRTAISRTLGLPAAEVEQLRRRSSASGSVDAEKAQGIRRVLGEATRHLTDRLAREVLAAVRHHAVTFHAPAPRRIELVGGDANDPQIRSALSSTLLLPARAMNVFQGIDTTAIRAVDRTSMLGEWAVALGLALKSFPYAKEFSIASSADEIHERETNPTGKKVVAAGVIRE